jgi:hypothetical protein
MLFREAPQADDDAVVPSATSSLHLGLGHASAQKVQRASHVHELLAQQTSLEERSRRMQSAVASCEPPETVNF